MKVGMIIKKFIGFALLLLVLTGCGSGSERKSVQFYMWGGDENINKYIDQTVAPYVLKEYDIELKRVAMETNDFMSKLQNEKSVGRKDGSIDLIWINGAAFKQAKDSELLSGDLLSDLENTQRFEQVLLETDSGEPIEGLEIPWGKTSFAFQVNTDNVKQSPLTIDELTQWIQNNPGRFTYPDAADFTGNGFIRQLIYSLNLDQINGDPTLKQRQKAYEYLSEIKPNLWRQGKDYPKTLQQLDQMFGSNDVDFTMGFNERRALPFIENGTFNKSTRTFALGGQAVTNAHYLTIPFNSPNKEKALQVIEALTNFPMQSEKLKSDVWGDGSVLALDQLTGEQQEKLESIESTGDHYLNEWENQSDFSAEMIQLIEEEWRDYVVRP
ncbi:ABC transporter substrate-binding protein [Paenisporosarcina sp. TG-14]|uniref:ABC transporter substrate-binding protein n=1 Tax=Paenisporosarcina sp. TG-14 TaxID=1231057 RepID=UPI0002E6B5C2|nr:ABC transporter substrate-binding protein [Paenisporosarcina sp. TG-14]